MARENSSANTGDGATAAIPSTSATAPAPSLAPAVADILKMSRAGVGDSVIIAYIDNTGIVYNLDANQVVYLHDQGISEKVISVMLTQKQKYVAPAAGASAQNPPAPGSYAATPSSQAVYTQPDGQAAAASTVYVIPYQASAPYYDYSYYPYWGYSVGYPWFYGGFVVDRFHWHGGGFRHGFQGPVRGGIAGGFHGSFHSHH